MSLDADVCARAIVSTVSGRAATGIDSGDRLDDLGLDSLDRVVLAVLIEQACGRAMPDAVLAAAITVADLERHVLGATAVAV